MDDWERPSLHVQLVLHVYPVLVFIEMDPSPKQPQGQCIQLG